MAVAIEIDLKQMMTRGTAVEQEDAAGEMSPTSTLIKITTGGSRSSDHPEKLQFTGFEENVKLKFHPYGKPRSEIKDGSVSSEMITAIPSTVMTEVTPADDVSGEKSPTSTLNQFTTEKEELQLPDSEDSVRLKFHPYKKPRSEMITSVPSTVISSRRTVPAAELEEFFASAEKELQNRFKNKYNYDIVNDTPLEGRFEWIQLKQ